MEIKRWDTRSNDRLTKLLDSAVFYPPVIYGTLVTNKTERPDILLFFSLSLNSQHSGEIKNKKTFTNTDSPSGRERLGGFAV